jgi:hypothetical protein
VLVLACVAAVVRQESASKVKAAVPVAETG